jgi:hypothetical protein
MDAVKIYPARKGSPAYKPKMTSAFYGSVGRYELTLMPRTGSNAAVRDLGLPRGRQQRLTSAR